ncbi:hypothetical protein [Rhodothermus profundi]|uniref:Uncharacterized protein n=1 Tax=Rhodothermus profundi TaxID=633813 RepID=A0A1M6WUT8_9BACT|nr:hypothetical protein [Rhodothermus profundi]SHK97305.1 hypothetical protein SAMN04488087_2436 [Rhodothermus profundi]
MKPQDWLPILLILSIFLLFLPFRRVYQQLPDWVAYSLYWAVIGLMVLAAFLAQATEHLGFVLAFFTLAFFYLVHTRRQQRQADRAS